MKNLMDSSLTRRGILRRVTVGAVVVGWSTVNSSWALAGADTAGVIALPRLDGRLDVAPEVLGRFAADFGNIVRGTPRAVLRPGSVNDVVAMVRYARVNGLTIAMSGQSGSGDDLESHSNYGQASVPGGIAVDARSLSRIHHVGATSAWVDAGVTWAQLLDVVLPLGLMPPAHTDYQHLSVGGTISVGGIGGHAPKHGVQADTVSEIEIVTGRGHLVRASPWENRDLFLAALAGGGQVGIITKARVNLVRSPARVSAYALYYDDLAVFLSDQERLMAEGRFDFLAGGPVRNADDTAWRYFIDAVSYYDRTPKSPTRLLAGLRDDRSTRAVSELSVRDWVFRLDPFEAWLRDNGYWHQPHAWLSVSLPASAIERYTRTVMAELTTADIGVGFVGLFPYPTAKITRPMFRTPDEPVAHLFDILRLPTDGAPDLARALDQNRRFYDLAVSLGGTRYLVGAIPDMTPRDWRTHFGGHWDTLLRSKRLYDPDHVLTPGQGFFPTRPPGRRAS